MRNTIAKYIGGLLALVLLVTPGIALAQGGAEAVTFVPFEDAMFGLQGVVPEGWTAAGPGAYQRGSSAMDATSLLIQAAPGTDAAALGALLAFGNAALVIGAIPFGIIFGTLSGGAGLSTAGAMGMSLFVFAGSAQFIAMGLVGAGTAWPMIRSTNSPEAGIAAFFMMPFTAVRPCFSWEVRTGTCSTRSC